MTTSVREPADAQRVASAPLGASMANADAARVLARPVTVHVDRVSLISAVKFIAASAGVRIQYRDKELDAVTMPVTLHVVATPLGTALDRVLQGTGLWAEALTSRVVEIKARMVADVPATMGSIAGKVTDVRTGTPLRGVTVVLDEAARGIVTGDDGVYRFPSVTTGTHRLTLRLLGFGQQIKSVMVSDGQTVMADVALAASANTLDQVVVTGTVAATELKAVPNAMTVITAKQIEERGITKIDQLFRGDVPGLFAQNLGSGALLDEVTMFSRGSTSLNQFDLQTGAYTAFTNPIKTYVDGVELADPKYLSQIDPKSIERIEILTGPQASTIYGSNAINGVMQIFTKRGTSNMPQLTLNLLSGWVQNNFSSALTPQHDHSAQLNGIEGRISYNTGGSWNYMGPWTPAKQTTRTSGYGGTRLEFFPALGAVTGDMTLRLVNTQTREHGADNEGFTANRETGLYKVVSYAGLSRPTTHTLATQTLGLALGYTPTHWWSHELGVGRDVSSTEVHITARGYKTISDTIVSMDQHRTDRRTLRYTTTARVPVSPYIQATMTGGVDTWQNLAEEISVVSQTLTGALTGATSISRQPGHNTGGLLQTQLNVVDRLFLTYGLRAEWNPDYGDQAQPNYAPRYGAAYTQELGMVTAKLRASYGRSTRPPAPTLKVAQLATVDGWGAQVIQDYGAFTYVLANPQLGPEYQQGGEAGLELYLGTRGSLIITQYNQTVDGLIGTPRVDSVRSLTPDPVIGAPGANGYGYIPQFQSLNIGSIRNQGWELQGSVNTGPFTTRGTYSWTKGRVIGITPKYRAQFAPQDYPQYQPGATFQYLPEHTWAFGVTYGNSKSNVAINVTGTGQIMNSFDALSLRGLYSGIRLPQDQLRIQSDRYVNFTRGYALADLVATHKVSSRADGMVQVQNLMNHYTNDYQAAYASLGRQVKMGVRVRLQ